MSTTFEVAADRHGRDAAGLAFGDTLTLDVSTTPNGGFLPGERDEVANNTWMVRVTANRDCYLRFTAANESHNAGVTDPLFLAGTESMKLPPGASYVSAKTVDPAAIGLLSVTFLE